VLVPVPPPTYTLAPGLRPLTPGQQAALDACLASLTGRLSGVLVVSAATSSSHHLIELITPGGTMLAMERITSASEAAATVAA